MQSTDVGDYFPEDYEGGPGFEEGMGLGVGHMGRVAAVIQSIQDIEASPLFFAAKPCICQWFKASVL